MMRSQKEPQNMKAFDVFITRMILQAASKRRGIPFLFHCFFKKQTQ